MDSMLQALPEGWGTIQADALNTELIENAGLILVDVRRDEEVTENGVIVAANLIHIPLEDFIAEKASWPADSGAPIVVYCGSGHRSTIAMTILRSYGYDNVRSLVSGFGGWVEAGYPVGEMAAP
jgi:rhodanese-related sulfurtransferase